MSSQRQKEEHHSCQAAASKSSTGWHWNVPWKWFYRKPKRQHPKQHARKSSDARLKSVSNFRHRFPCVSSDFRPSQFLFSKDKNHLNFLIPREISSLIVEHEMLKFWCKLVCVLVFFIARGAWGALQLQRHAGHNFSVISLFWLGIYLKRKTSFKNNFFFGQYPTTGRYVLFAISPLFGVVGHFPSLWCNQDLKKKKRFLQEEQICLWELVGWWRNLLTGQPHLVWILVLCSERPD